MTTAAIKPMALAFTASRKGGHDFRRPETRNEGIKQQNKEEGREEDGTCSY